jgi:hypothetical protein
MKLDVVWNCHGDFEKDYIVNDLLSKFDVTVHESKNDVFIDNALIVYGYDSPIITNEFSRFLEEYSNKNLAYGLMHLSNERLGHKFDYYSNAKYTLRTYLDPRIPTDLAYTFPIGYRSGHADLKPTSYDSKEYDFCFAGQPKNDRGELINVMSKHNSFVHTTRGFFCNSRLEVPQYQKVMSASKFVPCPMGNVNPETFRLFESLQSGSIPVLKRYSNPEYYEKLLGDHPIPIIDSWQELPSLLTIYQGDSYQNKIDELVDWYYNTKNRISEDVLEIVKHCNHG